MLKCAAVHGLRNDMPTMFLVVYNKRSFTWQENVVLTSKLLRVL